MPHPPAQRTRVARFYLFLVVAVIGALLDLWTKAEVFSAVDVTSKDIKAAVTIAEEQTVRRQEAGEEGWAHPRLPRHGRIEIWEDHLFFTPVLNPGAFGSLLAGRYILLVLLSVIAVVIVGWIVWKTPRPPYQVAVGLIVAGAIGNNYDRLRFHAVRDFIDFRVPEWPDVKWLNPWNTFNVADACIVVGIILFVILELFRKDDAGDKKKDGGKPTYQPPRIKAPALVLDSSHRIERGALPRFFASSPEASGTRMSRRSSPFKRGGHPVRKPGSNKRT